MSNSTLVSYVRLSPNHSGARVHPITRITPHYVDGNCIVETLGEVFAPVSRQASSNYGIGSDGRVGMYVEECNRAWTSGSYDNDNRAVTIECANLADGSLTDACWASLVELCADICRRNGISDCSYTGDTSGVLTMHRWFQSTDCPGPWLSGQFERLSREVNAKLRGGQGMARVNLGDVAARIHEDIMRDDRNGYSQEVRWGGDHHDGTKRLTINGLDYEYRLGSYDCASSVITAWRQALRHTPYEGRLDGATYTGDMEGPFVASGLFTSSLTPAKRGDVYLRPKTAYRGGHTALCQDGGADGVYGYDCLSEMYWNELGGATGGRVGDQTGHEGRIVPYYDLPWTTVLHYNGRGDFDVPTSEPSPVPDAPTASDESEEDVTCILQAGENGKHLYYFDGTRARHISPTALAGIQKAWQATHKSGLVTVKTLTQDEIDAMCAL